MGAHVWLLLATVVTELVVIRKWSRNLFTEPFPNHVKLGFVTGSVLLVVYPLMKVWGPSFTLTLILRTDPPQFGIPSARRYVRRRRKEQRGKAT